MQLKKMTKHLYDKSKTLFKFQENCLSKNLTKDIFSIKLFEN